MDKQNDYDFLGLEKKIFGLLSSSGEKALH